MKAKSTKFTVLIVDNDDSVRFVLREALADAGYEVVEARDGQEAMLWLSTGRPGLIVLDLKMPSMDGAGFVQALRTEPHLWNVPVLVLSAALDLEMQAGSLGVAGWLPKPFELDGLLEAVRQILAP